MKCMMNFKKFLNPFLIYGYVCLVKSVLKLSLFLRNKNNKNIMLHPL